MKYRGRHIPRKTPTNIRGYIITVGEQLGILKISRKFRGKSRCRRYSVGISSVLIFMAEKRFEYRYATEEELEELKQREFSGWMFTYVSAGMTRGETFDDWIREMVRGAEYVVKSYPRFVLEDMHSQLKRGDVRVRLMMLAFVLHLEMLYTTETYGRLWKSSIWAWLECAVLFSIVIGTTTLQIEV
ncbi:hypothetical protein YC2023_042565 [Brassica napus]